MKRSSLILLASIFVIISLSCSLTSAPNTDAENPLPSPIVTETSVQTITVEMTDVGPTETPPTPAGFLTGTPINVSTLPPLTAVPAGGEPTSCYSNSSEPSITIIYGIFPYQTICLNNFPTAPDSPGITLTLVDPSGQSFSETFSHSPEGILNSKGIKSGSISTEEGFDGNPGTSGVRIELYLPASLPCGDWTALVNTQDGALNVGPSNLSMDCSSPHLSVLADVSSNPFISPNYSWSGPTFSDSDTLYIVGSAYPADTAITIALYHQDASYGDQGMALYAVSMQTDQIGNFQVPFLVGPDTQKGPYVVIAAPAIDAKQHLYPFGARFLIE